MRARWALCAVGLLVSATVVWQNAPSSQELIELKREALAVFSEILQDGSAAERLSAVNSLVRFGDDSVVPLLTERLLTDEASFVRRAAAEGLLRFRSAQAAEALRQAARTDSVASIRWAAAISLGEPKMLIELLLERETLAAAALALQEPTAAARLPNTAWRAVEITLLKSISEREAFNVVERAAMLKALAQLGSLAVIDSARQTLSNTTEDPFVRGAAAFALGVLNVRNAVPELVRALSEDAEAIQVGAAGALGLLRDPAALGALGDLLRKGRSPQARIAAASALAPLGSRAVPALAQALLGDEVPQVRQAALRALRHIKTSEATRAVLDFLASNYLQQCDPATCGGVALETLRALAELGQAQLALHVTLATLNALREALPFLFAFAEGELVQTLSTVGRVAPEVFDIVLQDQSPFVRALGIAAFAAVYHAEARELLMRYISDENVLVRRAAVEGLAPWAIPDDTELFAKFADERDLRTRAAALSALARVGDTRALEPLRRALRSESISVRLDAAGAALAFALRWGKTPSPPSRP